jgi:protein-S-isoprenylcysteine O-methyltransferase Ste14
MNIQRIEPPSYLFAAMALMAMLHLLVPGAAIIGYPWQLLGSAPLLLGILLNLCADAAFKRHGTTVKPFEPSSTLITTGVFRVSRHPMYLGMVLILLGIAVLMGSVTPLLAVMAFAVLMDRRFIRIEERMLARQFGTAWQAYKQRVRRWL